MGGSIDRVEGREGGGYQEMLRRRKEGEGGKRKVERKGGREGGREDEKHHGWQDGRETVEIDKGHNSTSTQ